jgi:hypothetical protein
LRFICDNVTKLGLSSAIDLDVTLARDWIIGAIFEVSKEEAMAPSVVEVGMTI